MSTEQKPRQWTIYSPPSNPALPDSTRVVRIYADGPSLRRDGRETVEVVEATALAKRGTGLRRFKTRSHGRSTGSIATASPMASIPRANRRTGTTASTPTHSLPSLTNPHRKEGADGV
jgi:hypothetical protein